MRKQFRINGAVKKARLYVSGAGLFHVEVNGRKAGTEYFAPGCIAADTWMQIYTYDVTDYVRPGENVVGAMLGNGWAKGRFGTFREANTPYTDSFSLIAELRITLEDGSETVIGSGTDWECAPSPVVDDGIYDGEIYDAREQIRGWSEPDTIAKENLWEQAEIFRPESPYTLEDRLSPPGTVHEIMKPVEVIHTPAGETVLDFGQNMAGWVRFTVREPEGAKITLSYGEILQDGNFYRDNLRSAKAQYTYISDGEERTVEPYFTFFGFRYVKIEGLKGEADPEDYLACAVYSDMEETGVIRTTDPWLNRLFENAKWSQKGNFLDVPTDCPQRDERMGWTGDAQVFARTASFNMDTYAFYTKFLHDLAQEQKMNGGMVGNVVPSFLKTKSTVGSPIHGGAAAWGDCAVILPWTLYQQYGDKTILSRQYGSMKAWVDWIRRQDEADGGTRLWRSGFQYGDWLALDGPVEGGTAGGTDVVLIASAYYMHSAELTAKAAEVLGKEEDAETYRKLAEEIRTAIRDEYYTKNGRCAIPTQTAHIIALAFGIVDDTVREKTAQGLQELLKKRNMHLSTGILGTPFRCKVLSDEGLSESAYEVLMQEDFPGWLYEVKMGATTIWERWNSVLPDGKISGTGMNSLNHYAYGSIVQWMYENMCGIRQQETSPGFGHFVIRPEMYGKLGGAYASYMSPKGRVESGWKIEGKNTVRMKVTVPFDSVAEVYFPDAQEGSIRGKDVHVCVDGSGMWKADLAAGTHEITYTLNHPYWTGYSLDNTLDELRSNEETKKLIAGLEMMTSRMPESMRPAADKSLAQYRAELTPVVRAKLEEAVGFDELEKKLNEVKVNTRSVELKL